jgi:hypothetical protein
LQDVDPEEVVLNDRKLRWFPAEFGVSRTPENGRFKGSVLVLDAQHSVLNVWRATCNTRACPRRGTAVHPRVALRCNALGERERACT